MHYQFLGVALLGGCLASQFAIAQTPPHSEDSLAARPSVAAVVDGHTISTDAVEKIALRKYGQDILDRLIDNYLIDQEAARLHVEVTEAEIDDQVQTLSAAIKPRTLEEGLKEHHETLAELRDEFRQRLLALKLAATSVAPGHFAHTYVILIRSDNTTDPADASALARATDLQKKLQAGAKFQEMARQNSQDPSSKTRGGDVGILFAGAPRDGRVIQAALALKAGMILDHPVKTPAGYYLMRVSSTDSEHPAEENQIYSDAKRQYEMYQGSRNLPEYLQGLRSKATITRGALPWINQ